MEEVPPEVPQKPIRIHYRALRFVRVVREIGNNPVIIKLKWLLAGMLIFAFSVILTQVQFNNVNSSKRDEIQVESESRDYTLTLAQWSTDKVIFDACVVLHTQSVGNRQWKVWLLDKLESITPADSPVADDFITEGRAKLEEYVPEIPRESCVDPGDRPMPPESFDPTVNPPTEEGES